MKYLERAKAPTNPGTHIVIDMWESVNSLLSSNRKRTGLPKNILSPDSEGPIYVPK